VSAKQAANNNAGNKCYYQPGCEDRCGGTPVHSLTLFPMPKAWQILTLDARSPRIPQSKASFHNSHFNQRTLPGLRQVLVCTLLGLSVPYERLQKTDSIRPTAERLIP
jgi:hypothetical protein